MPILDFSKLTPDNQAVKDLKDLIELTVFQNEDMERFMTFMPKVTNGKKVGFIGEMEDVGIAGAGCDPEYQKWLSLPPRKYGKLATGKFRWKCAMRIWRILLQSTA